MHISAIRRLWWKFNAFLMLQICLKGQWCLFERLKHKLARVTSSTGGVWCNAICFCHACKAFWSPRSSISGVLFCFTKTAWSKSWLKAIDRQEQCYSKQGILRVKAKSIMLEQRVGQVLLFESYCLDSKAPQLRNTTILTQMRTMWNRGKQWNWKESEGSA